MKFVTTSTFRFQSFQNWQGEFVAVGSIVVFTFFPTARFPRIEACGCLSPGDWRMKNSGPLVSCDQRG
jgi:hypothetical protein